MRIRVLGVVEGNFGDSDRFGAGFRIVSGALDVG